MDPYILGVVTGLGGTLGSLTAYWLGMKSQKLFKGRRFHFLMHCWMRRFGGPILFLFSFIAFMPADFASIVAGTTRYPLSRYLVWVGLGSVAKMVLVFYVFTRFIA